MKIFLLLWFISSTIFFVIYCYDKLKRKPPYNIFWIELVTLILILFPVSIIMTIFGIYYKIKKYIKK
jgi:hypothetical protein